jgi:tRNA(Ile)-lysidine synthase
LTVTLDASELLDACAFPPAETHVDLAVSGGPDSLGLLLLALAAGLRVAVHHVDHHARATSGDDARFVEELCQTLGVPCIVHDVEVPSGANFEARARAERRRVLPDGALTGHTMDDLVETVLLNMMRGAGLDGLSPMVNDPTKPLRDLRRSDVHDFAKASGHVARHDESNDNMAYRRNRVRHQLLPLMCEVAERDVVPVIARQAAVLYEERSWLETLSVDDVALELSDADCRQLREWPRARLRRWLRLQLFAIDDVNERHPPSAAEVDRAVAVVVGEAVATELSGGRRLARRDQRLTLEDGSTTLTIHG